MLQSGFGAPVAVVDDRNADRAGKDLDLYADRLSGGVPDRVRHQFVGQESELLGSLVVQGNIQAGQPSASGARRGRIRRQAEDAFSWLTKLHGGAIPRIAGSKYVFRNELHARNFHAGKSDGVWAIQAESVTTQPRLVPAPASLKVLGGIEFEIDPGTSIVVDGPESQPIGEYLAGLLRPSTGLPFPVTPMPPVTPVTRTAKAAQTLPENSLFLGLSIEGDLGSEGYTLDVAGPGITLIAGAPQGLFRGVQTLRQLLPPSVERKSVTSGPWNVPGVRIVDRPRWGWRGSMLDVARHFFSVADVKRHIDLACRYKLNVLHLHLTDDQGWRIHIDRWPRLTQHGGSLEVGGTQGGYYTKDDYREIVSYAAAHYMTVVPEIDMPGHTRAALASYPELNCDGRPRPLYTGTDVGFSSLCIGKEVTDRFVDEVIAEIADLTPGPYIHIGGDEAAQTAPPEYITFMRRVDETIRHQKKSLVGWEEVAKAALSANSVVQFWNNGSGSHSGAELARKAVERGSKLVMSPSDRAYLDMKYDSKTSLGTKWAGFVDVRRAYEWDPADHIPEIGESDIAGVEAPIWTETIATASDLEFMVWPRLAGIAELGWVPARGSWDEYRVRLGAQGPRLEATGVNFFRSSQVPWEL